mmetsp:Transcript_42474/g.77607  ORF Transcript_42474/g.77607 Transcript_42474/m.77607 type:complete len:100 (+) Transcript_42474:51-350(+)
MREKGGSRWPCWKVGNNAQVGHQRTTLPLRCSEEVRWGGMQNIPIVPHLCVETADLNDGTEVEEAFVADLFVFYASEVHQMSNLLRMASLSSKSDSVQI